jgi:hypothetical protein
MAKFHFHTVLNGIRIIDDEGGDFENLGDATHEAIFSLREILADNLKKGRPIELTSIEIAGEDGQVLMQVPYTMALGT